MIASDSLKFITYLGYVIYEMSIQVAYQKLFMWQVITNQQKEYDYERLD